MRILRSLCLVGMTFFALLTRAAEDNLQRVRFREVDTLFANPGQGWMSQQRNPNGGTRFPCSVAYIPPAARRPPLQREVHRRRHLRLEAAGRSRGDARHDRQRPQRRLLFLAQMAF
jgi:hypothetical protein